MYCRPINLTINHNWDDTIKVMKKLLALKDHNLNVESYGNAQHYNLGSLGTISDHMLSANWNRLSGPVIDQTMPWLSNMLESMQHLTHDNGCISYIIGNGASHIDFPHMKTALNYVFKNTDSSAFTWVNDGTINETYPSNVGDAWLLNTQIPHGVTNSGERWTLSIHYDAEYDQVSKWFDSQTDLVFGKIE
jgi:hypothetical protein